MIGQGAIGGLTRWAEARPLLTRWLLAGPATLIAALMSMASMPLFLPEGRAGIDHLAFPIVLFPAIWALLFFYTCLEARLGRAIITMTALIGAQTLLILSAFMGG